MPITRLRIGFIGAGRLARTLAPAWAAQGMTITGAASRRRETAAALVQSCGGNACAFETAQALADACDLVFLTTPDDAIATTAASVRWRQDQRVVHCSAATDVAALQAANETSAMTGGFHPLQIFADPEVAIKHLAGSSVAIEAASPLRDELQSLADCLGMRPLHLPPGARVAYHIAGNLAASGVLGVLKEAEDLWVAAGLPREAAMPSLLPLTRGTVAAAEALGLAKALAGPVSRADTRVLQAHLHRLSKIDSSGTAFYSLLMERLVSLGELAGRLTPEQALQLRDLLAQPPQS